MSISIPRRSFPTCMLAAVVWTTVASLGAEPDTPERIVALGDSITKGVRTGVAADEIFSHLVERRVQESHPKAIVINEGIGGERTDQALARLDNLLAKHRPTMMLVMYGTNDAYVDHGRTEPRLTREAYAANLEAIIATLRAAKVTPILMTEPAWAQGAAPDGSGEHPDQRPRGIHGSLPRRRHTARRARRRPPRRVAHRRGRGAGSRRMDDRPVPSEPGWAHSNGRHDPENAPRLRPPT